MRQAVLLGDTAFFRIKAGANPHTRDRWGRRKQVDLKNAIAQWRVLRATLESHGVRVHVIPPVEDQPGLAFPANAGFRYADTFYLSNLNPARVGEREHYRRVLTELGLEVRDLACPFSFEGEADFIPVGDPSGDPAKTIYLFTYGRIEKPRWVPRFGIPPYRRVYGFRSDRGALSTLQAIVGNHEIFPLELIDQAHYHGDTVMCPFGPHQEFLLGYLNVLSPNSRAFLQGRLGDRLIPLSDADGCAFAANSFQITVQYHGEKQWVLLTPDGLTGEVYRQVRSYGVIPCPVNVSEFLDKGGGAVKCMLLNLGEL